MQQAINSTTMEKIDALQSLGIKPSLILVELRTFGFEVPTIRQLTNHLAYNRKKINFSVNPMTLQEIQEWCDLKKKIPTDLDEVFVIKYECCTNPNREFRLFLSTRRLLLLTNQIRKGLDD